MKRVKTLNGMTFNPNALFIKEEMETDALIATSKKSAAGTNICFVANNQNQNITLQTLQYSYITDEQREIIMGMFIDLGQTYTIGYLEGGTEEVGFKYDEPPTFDETYEGSCLFTGEIFLYAV